MAHDGVDDIHVVFVATPFYGHVRILRSLAKILAQRGYSITFITGSNFKESLQGHENLEFVQVQGRADFDPARLEEYFPDRRRQASVIWDMTNFFWLPMHEQHDVLQRVINRPTLAGKKVVVVGDFFYTGTLPMLLGSPKATRVACMGVSGNPLFFLSKDTPAFGSGLLDQGEVRNAELNAHALEVMSGLTDVVEHELERYNCTEPLPTKFPPALMQQCHDILLQLCPPALEPPRTDLPDKVRFAGSLVGGNDPRPAPEWFQSFVVDYKGDEPLVVVTEGTCRGTDVNELIIPTIEACKQLPVRVVVCSVYAPAPADFVLPDNVRWASWIPFEELFKYTSIVVSNGGYGGINQAFAYGIPMIVSGTSEDHLETTLRAEMTGAAINLRLQTPSAEQVKEAVEKMLEEKSYREHAQKLKESYAKYDTVKIFIETIHELVDTFYGGSTKHKKVQNSRQKLTTQTNGLRLPKQSGRAQRAVRGQHKFEATRKTRLQRADTAKSRVSKIKRKKREERGRTLVEQLCTSKPTCSTNHCADLLERADSTLLRLA